jgi:hypothetical protein
MRIEECLILGNGGSGYLEAYHQQCAPLQSLGGIVYPYEWEEFGVLCSLFFLESDE